MPLEQYPWLIPAYELLVKLYKERKAHHAYLFKFDGDIGQLELFKLLSQFFQCKKNQEAERFLPCGECRSCVAHGLVANPDFYNMSRNKKHELATNISVDTVRDTIDKIALEPSISSQNIVVVEDVTRMNIFSSNAMLKTLEEPSTHTFFFMGLPAGFSVLPTIRSRCMEIKLPSPNTEQLRGLLSKEGINDPELSYLIALGQKKLTTIKKMHEINFLQQYIDLLNGFYAFMQNYEIELLIEKLNTSDIEIFTWQIDILIEIFQLIKLQALDMLEGLKHPLYLCADLHPQDCLHLIIANLQSYHFADIEAITYKIHNELLLLKHFLVNFPAQFNAANVLKGLAYKATSYILLELYALRTNENNLDNLLI